MVILSHLNAGLLVVNERDTRMSIELMVLNWKLAYSLSIKNKHLKRVCKCRIILDEAKSNSTWIG
jgi:hypothetical protein